MPCNLAVSITKAAVTEQQMRDLLTPSVVEQLVRGYVVSQGRSERADSFHDQAVGDYFSIRMVGAANLTPRLQCRLGGYFGIDIFVDLRSGAVTVNGTGTDQTEQCERLSVAVRELLAKAADRLLAGQVAAALASFGTVTQRHNVPMRNDGQAVAASVLTVRP